MVSTSKSWKDRELRSKMFYTRKTHFEKQNVEEEIASYADQMEKGKGFATSRTSSTKFHARTVRRKISIMARLRTVLLREVENT